MYCHRALSSFYFVFVLLLVQNVFTQRYKTIFQLIQESPEHDRFNSVIGSNREAKLKLHREQLTIFVPENEAFDMFEGHLRPDIVLYHMSYELKTLYELNSTNVLSSVVLENPPLWVTRVNGDIYVNNAKVLRDKSDYTGKTRQGDMGKLQILHVVDEVLNPYIFWPKFSPNAYDLISDPSSWNFGPTRTLSNFLTKIQEHRLQYVFKQNSSHTFFVPLDYGMDAHKFKMLDKHLILGHVIPFYVLFTRPTRKNFRYESLANDDFIYIVLSMEDRGGKTFVKGFSTGTIGDFSGQGEFEAEIVLANIPVKNGVVHLISQPLGIFKRKLKPFPYLAILDKLNNDPNLDVFYQMGGRTGFHEIFKRPNVSFTYFVSSDIFWKTAKKEGLSPIEKDIDILKRHMVISKHPYSIEQLFALTKANNYTQVSLPSLEGSLEILVFYHDGEYYIKWQRFYVKVLRPNYECSNGMVHVLAGPFVHLKRGDDDDSEQHDVEDKSAKYWKNFISAVNKIF